MKHLVKELMVFDMYNPFLLDVSVELQTIRYKYKMVLSHHRINHRQPRNLNHWYILILLLRKLDEM